MAWFSLFIYKKHPDNQKEERERELLFTLFASILA